jgi:HK97 family phage prohead protease
MTDTQPPRDMLVRAVYPGVELRSEGDSLAMPTMHGQFAVFDQWTTIESAWEGHFIERIAPGAFAKTFKENRSGMRVLFQHGMDPQIGDKPLGPIEDLSETATGASYSVPLLDTTYNRDLIPGLEAGLYGASFRFRVMKEELDQKPKGSSHNPDAIPERTIREAQVFEFGPVTFPAYAGATAGVRSLTDEYIRDLFTAQPEKLRELFAGVAALPMTGAGPEPTPASGAAAQPAEPVKRRFNTREEYLEWISRI